MHLPSRIANLQMPGRTADLTYAYTGVDGMGRACQCNGGMGQLDLASPTALTAGAIGLALGYFLATSKALPRIF